MKNIYCALLVEIKTIFMMHFTYIKIYMTIILFVILCGCET